jgi:hypothetical protein
VPAFWVAAGTNDSDYKPATAFAAALDRVQQVPFVKLSAGDTANAWAAALPVALAWLWQQVAPPDLRVQFPVRAGASFTTLHLRPVKTLHHTACKSSAALRHAYPRCTAPDRPARVPAKAGTGQLAGDPQKPLT